MPADTLTIDGLTLPVVRPASSVDIAALVREGRPLYSVGGGTHLHVGLPPTRPGVAVDLTGLDKLIDHAARDMTVTVQAGMRVACLQEILAAEGQRLPIDVPLADRATVGGSIAANVSGPRRLGSGTLRDYVIGISTVGADGHETKAGGRVVKNVAGYDLCKLHTGAFGTLGIITQVTLKVRPVPEASALVAVGCHETSLHLLLDTLHASRTRPMCIEALSKPLADGLGLPETQWSVVVGFEDSAAAVEWQTGQVIQELAEARFTPVRVSAAEAPALWAALTEMPLGARAAVTYKATMTPGKVAAFCYGGRGLTRVHAHAGSGVVWGHLPEDVTPEDARERLTKLAAMAESGGGGLTVPRCPAGWKRGLPVWGAPRGDQPLMFAVKKKLDPQGLFNPGRFLDGA